MNNKQMAGYFSNHSQSRFLANSQGITTTTPSSTSNTSITASSTTTLSGTASHTSITSNNNTTNTQLPTQVQSNLPSTASATHARPTRVPSRHFSTSLSGSGDEKSHAKDKSAGGREGNPNGGLSSTVHPLRHTYVRTIDYNLINELLTLAIWFFSQFFISLCVVCALGIPCPGWWCRERRV